MTFAIGPVNIEIRKNLSNEVKEHKVHHKIDVVVDNKMKKPFVKEDKEKGRKNKKNKKFITIDGVKNNSNNFQVEAIKTEEDIAKNPEGTFIDKIK